MTRKKYSVSNMHCASCATMIECDLEDNNVKSKCSYADQMLEVEFDENTMDESKIKEIVTVSGYEIVEV
jgi:copper chaperone CopZ